MNDIVSVKEAKMSVGWEYSGFCCPQCTRPDRWSKRGGFNKNNKSKTLRTFRNGSMGKNNRRTSIFKGLNSQIV